MLGLQELVREVTDIIEKDYEEVRAQLESDLANLDKELVDSDKRDNEDK